MILNECLGGPAVGRSLNDGHQDYPYGDSSIREARDLNFLGPQVTENDTSKVQDCTVYSVDKNSKVEDGQTELHAANRRGHIEMVKLLHRGANGNKPDARGWSPNAPAEQPGNRSINDLSLSYKNRSPDGHKIEIIGPEISDNIRNTQSKYRRHGGPHLSNSHLKRESINLGSCNSSRPSEGEVIKSKKTRITIHMPYHNTGTSQMQRGKLIVLPDSIDELLRIAGKPST